MQNKQETFLTIIIPTHNRADIIDANLNNLSKLYGKYKLKLIVCDNASTDNTSSVLNYWKERIHSMQIISHDKNVLFDRNVTSGYLKVDTPYCWVLGDANTVDVNNFEKIVKALRKSPQAVIINDPKKSVMIEDTIFTNPKTLFRELGWYTTLLCSCIINKDFITEDRCARYFDTGFVHMGVFYDYLANFEEINVHLLSSITVTSIQLGDKSSNSWKRIPFEVFGKRWFSFVMSLPYSYGIDDKFYCIRQHDKNQHVFAPWSLLVYKITGYCSFEDYHDARHILRFIYRYPLIITDIISILPSFPFLTPFLKGIKHIICDEKQNN